MTTLKNMNTWKLEGKKVVGYKWVVSIKYKADGTLDWYKARFVAKGYIQTYDIDYTKTLSRIAKLNTVRVLISLAANLDGPLHQFDVKNTFFHDDLEKEVYMDIPWGFISSQVGTICKLKKALYGLKQSPRAWFGRFSLAMKNFGFKHSNVDHTLFLKHQRGVLTALIVYVNDMITIGNDKEQIRNLQEYLATGSKWRIWKVSNIFLV